MLVGRESSKVATVEAQFIACTFCRTFTGLTLGVLTCGWRVWVGEGIL